MKHEPPDKQSENQNFAQKEVQDYLDLLLTQASETPEAQVNQTPERVKQTEDRFRETRVQETVIKTKLAIPPLTMVGGTTVTAKQTAQSRSRSFAEPVRSLPFKMPRLKRDVESFAPLPVVKGTLVETFEIPPLEVKSPEIKPTETKPETKAPRPEALIKVTPEPVKVAPAQSDSHHTESPPIQAAKIQPPKTSEWLENGRPIWAQQHFECLLFSVGGLTLAVPLVELGSIYPITTELTPLFGQVDWFMGLLPVKGINLRTVNTAKVVMPERYVDSMQAQFSYVISIADVDWGLAVDTVSNAVTLDPEDVRWRGERGKRPWLAGTVVDHMCALLDVSQLAAMFSEQDAVD